MSGYVHLVLRELSLSLSISNTHTHIVLIGQQNGATSSLLFGLDEGFIEQNLPVVNSSSNIDSGPSVFIANLRI